MTLVTDRKDLDTTIGPDGQQKNYLVLSEEERQKGFVRPVREVYLHIGRKICGKPARLGRALPPGKVAFVCINASNHEGECTGWTAVAQSQLDRLQATGYLGGCGTETRMGRALAETYARQPDFYSGTFCCACRDHYPVGEVGEFIWPDGTKVGT